MVMNNNLTGVNSSELPCAAARQNLFPSKTKKEIEQIKTAQLITKQFGLLQVKGLNNPDCLKALETTGHQRYNAANLTLFSIKAKH